MKQQKRLPNSLFTPLEIAEFLRVAKTTIYDWVYKKKIPYYKIGGAVRFDMDEIYEWVKKAS